MSSSSYTSYRLSNILAIVRRANNRVSRLAAAARMSLTPTHHAKRRAHKLELKVDINSARNLDHKQVSVVPLPVLATPPPLPQPLPLPQAPLALLHEPVVFRENEISRAVVGREREIRRAARPLLRCEIPSDIAPHDASLFSTASACSNVELETPADEIRAHAPVVLRGQNVPWRPVTSRWSVSTVGSEGEGEAEVTVEDVDITDAAGVYAQEESRAYEGSMDLPIIISPDSPAGPYGELEYVHPRRIQSPEPLELNVRGDTRRVVRAPRHLTNLDVDVARISWGSSSASSSSPSSAGTHSSSSDSSSSASSATSVDSPTKQASNQPKLLLRIKRSISSRPDVADSNDTRSISERRPKYGRKSWAAPYPPILAGRRQSTRISAVTNMNTNTTTTMTNRSSNRF